MFKSILAVFLAASVAAAAGTVETIRPAGQGIAREQGNGNPAKALARRQLSCASSNEFICPNNEAFCCPTTQECCNDGSCVDPLGKCCSSGGNCPPGTDCCDNGCIPVGTNCCADGGFCEAGSECVIRADGTKGCRDLLRK